MSIEDTLNKGTLAIRFNRWAERVGLARKLVIGLMIIAFGMTVLTYAVLSGWAQFGTSGMSVKRVLIILT